MTALISMASGIACATIYYAQSNEYITASLTWWQYLLIALIPTVIGFILDLVIDILKNKGIISEDDATELKSKVDDIEDKLDDASTDKDEETQDK